MGTKKGHLPRLALDLSLGDVGEDGGPGGGEVSLRVETNMMRNHDLMVEHGPGTWDDDFTFLIRFFE